MKGNENISIKKNEIITIGGLHENDIITMYGYEFIVTNLNQQIRDGESCHYYKGICTSNKCNDGIRNTLYNGGSYGGCDWVKVVRVNKLDYTSIKSV